MGSVLGIWGLLAAWVSLSLPSVERLFISYELAHDVGYGAIADHTHISLDALINGIEFNIWLSSWGIIVLFAVQRPQFVTLVPKTDPEAATPAPAADLFVVDLHQLSPGCSTLTIPITLQAAIFHFSS
jgi:hypothetical protein